MKEKKLVPKLRFPGFTEPWEQRKLGDFTNQISTSVNPEDAKLPLWSLTAEAGLIEKTDRYERDFLVKKKDQFKRIETNTLVYNPMNITIGSIDIYTGRFPIAVSGYYVSIVYDKTLDTDFLKEILLLPSSLKMYKNYATGSLIERQRVQYHTFSKLQFLFPTLEEQRTIGRLFKSLNLIITLHQRKLEHLKLKKKSLLQKLFPKEGEVYPELRFSGFTDPWEQRKFKDIAFKRGKISEADLPYVEFEDINSGIGTLNKNILQKVGHKKGILFEAGDVLFGKLRPYLQNWLLCQFMGIAVGDFWVFQPQIVSSAFLYYLIQSEAYQSVANISSGTKMPRSSWSLVSETRFSIPKYKEATMIGEFFTSIDKNITLHQRKLEHLQLLKKALLQQLFV